MTYTSERTAEINAAADAISALNVGDGVSVKSYTDIDAFTIISKTATTLTLQRDIQTLMNESDLVFHVGGFSAHCSNQGIQDYSYERDPDGFVIKITLRRWKDEDGNERRKWKRVGCGTFQQGGNVYAGRNAFYDYNF